MSEKHTPNKHLTPDEIETEARQILSEKHLPPEQFARAYHVAKQLAVCSTDAPRPARYAFLGYQVLDKIGETGDRQLVDRYIENAEKDSSPEGKALREKLKRSMGKI